MKRFMLPALLVAIVAGLTLVASAFAAAPGNTANPTITGTAKVGETLNVSNGTWTGSPTSYTYRWQRCTSSTSCTTIAGATAQTYAVRATDAGRTLRAIVTATNADGSSTANSNMTATVAAGSTAGAPVNTARPSVSGDAIVGGTLTAENGAWTNSPTTFAYQWLQCDRFGGSCIDVAGATGRTYGIQFSDVEGTLRVDVTAKNASGSATRRSTQSDLVQPIPVQTVPGNKAPTISFLSLKRLGTRVSARFRVCDDAAKAVEVIERDSKAGALAYTRRFSVVPNSCVTATRSWVPAPRFRTKGRFVVTLRAVDKSGASSRFVSRSLVR
jgi:hypothetical protein